jgi:hypothetical protein
MVVVSPSCPPPVAHASTSPSPHAVPSSTSPASPFKASPRRSFATVVAAPTSAAILPMAGAPPRPLMVGASGRPPPSYSAPALASQPPRPTATAPAPQQPYAGPPGFQGWLQGGSYAGWAAAVPIFATFPSDTATTERVQPGSVHATVGWPAIVSTVSWIVLSVPSTSRRAFSFSIGEPAAG